MESEFFKCTKPIDKPHHISFLIPTRGRPQSLDRVFQSMGRTVSNADYIDAWIYVDHDDDITKQYIHSEAHLQYPFKINWVFGTRTLSQGQMINILRQKCTTNPGIYLGFPDDYIFTSESWDEAIRDTFEQYDDRIVLSYIQDPHANPDQITMAAISAEWTNVTGRLLTEFFPFWNDDTWLDHVSQFVKRKVRTNIKVESIGGRGKTTRLRNLPFWQAFFTNLTDERLAEAKLLLKAIYTPDSSEYQQYIKDAERLAEAFIEQREKVTKSYLLNLEKECSSDTGNSDPLLILLHSALEAKAVGHLCAKAHLLLQSDNVQRALKMLDNVGLAEQDYKNINHLRATCLERLQNREAATSVTHLKESTVQPERELSQEIHYKDEKSDTTPLTNSCKTSFSNEPKFTFIMIVLNGMPFIEYSLKSVYEFAHEIIIIEGAVEKCMFAANQDGRSTDGTVEFIKSFPDPQRKIKLFQGRWPEKCEMQNEALKYVTGDYVWLIDSDEVYKKEDLEKIKTILIDDPSITQVNFIPDHFWKGLDYIFVSPQFFETPRHFRRLFKYVPGAVFTSHRPPTMMWPGSDKSTEQMHLLDGTTTRQMGIVPFHYSYVLDTQVRQKIELYHRYGWGEDWNVDLHEWYEECFLKWTPENKEQIEARYPVWTGDKNSHTLLFTGTHPEIMKYFQNKFVEKEEIIGKRPPEGHSNIPDGRRKQVRVATDYVQNGTHFETESSFGAEIRKLFTKIRPRKIIETGTYLGTGTTTIISGALKALDIHDAEFYTIEADPQNYTRVKEYFTSNNMNIRVLNGLSIPRSMLPDRNQIAQKTITNVDYDGIFVDHKEESRVELYYNETDFPQVEDDLLYKCLERFDFKPDFVLLDSAGHMGNIEFDYLMVHLQGECYIALDDVYHVKHHRSFKRIQNDPRFDVLVTSKEKFGFCIARFTPRPAIQEQPMNHLLWVRTDSIGDAVLSSSMLPFIRKRFGDSKITAVCREHIAELYESCPYVDAVLTFEEKRILNDPPYASEIFQRVRNVKADCTLNTVYSREVICDYMVAASGAGLRIGMHGNLCNTTEELRTKHNQWYTHLLPSAGEWKPEMERHIDFLQGVGCQAEELKPQIWLTTADEAFADEWFGRYDLRPDETIVLFAGVQSPERIYTHYGKAMAGLCKENGFSVVALGTNDDGELNRQNLKDIESAGVRVFDLSGKFTLRQSAAIIKRCRLAVGAETGLAHISAAVGTKHVIVIGGGQFGRFMPYSPLTSLVCLPIECYGCGWKCVYKQSQIYCMTSISPIVIERAVRETLLTTTDKPRIFVQEQSLWKPRPGEPRWKSFNELLDIESVEIVPIGRPIQRKHSTERIVSSVDVSIVVATRDRGNLLDDMLASLKEATEGISYEVIVIEGGSTDNTHDVLRKHGITQVYDESEHMGPGKHSWSQWYNFGFSKSRGTWAMHASDDIVFEKGSVTKAVNLLKSQKSPSVAGGVFFYKEVIPEYSGWEQQGICFALGHKLLMNFGLIRLDVFRELGGYDEGYIFRCPDIDLSFMVYESGRQLIPLADCLLIHNNAMDELKKKNLQVAEIDYQYLLRKWKHFVPTKLDPPKRLFWEPKYTAVFTMPAELENVDEGIEHLWHGLACLQIDQPQEAIRWLSQALNASCKHWTMLWLAAEALYNIGFHEQAQKTADFVARINPGCVEIQPLLKRLKSNSLQSPIDMNLNAGSGPVIHTPRSHFVIEVKHGGIGDHLFYSHLPRIAKQSGKYDRVYVSNHSAFRNLEYRKLLWECNPYVDGFCNENGEYPIFDSVEEGMNILDKIMVLRGLDDGKRFHEPELYLKSQSRPDLFDAVVYDPNFVSYVGDISSEEIESFLRNNHIYVTHQMALWEKHYALDHDGAMLQTNTLEEFCQVILSCKQLLCLSSGTATLASALGKPATVFYGNGQKPMFHHSRLHRYINCSTQQTPILNGGSRMQSQESQPVINIDFAQTL